MDFWREFDAHIAFMRRLVGLALDVPPEGIEERVVRKSIRPRASW